jgi:23S rRNA pseudouridine2605 synthase
MLSVTTRVASWSVVAARSRLFRTFPAIGQFRQLDRTMVFSTSRRHVAASSNEGPSLRKTPKNTHNIRRKDRSSSSLYRADRVLANRGWGSRSECFEVLKSKRVFQKVVSSGEGQGIDIEMKRIMGPSEKIPMDAALFVDGKVEVAKLPPLLRIFHKPKWMLSVMKDSRGRSHLGDLDGELISGMHPVGRLDYDTSGLLLFSSDGTLTQMLLHPNGMVQKEYVALVVGTVDEPDLRERLSKGVQTSMGVFPSDLVSARAIPADDVRLLIADVIKNLPSEYDLDRLEEKNYLFFKDAKELSEVRLVVEEGKHRMVRRILANCGHPVIGLKRERLGEIHLEGLEEGAMRDLTPQEHAWATGLGKNRKPTIPKQLPPM